jgi:lipooligosaccharide transport system ATP-binding protein
MSLNLVIEARGLTKVYGDKVVVNGVSLQIFKGECFGILGPNGAGKSTLMKMMYGTATPKDGELYILGLNSKNSLIEIKSRIGVIPQEDGLDIDFTPRENLEIYSRFHGIDTRVAQQRIDELLRLMRMDEYADQHVSTLSGGLRRRLAIARGMVNRPEVLFLDEPTAGLDPQARIWIWGFLKKIKAEMGTLVLTTHYMEEAEQACDRIAIIDQGVVLALGTPKELIEKHIGHEVVEFESNPRDIQYDIDKLKEKNLSYQVIRNMIQVHIKAPLTGREVLTMISSRQTTNRFPNLNDVFLKVAGHDLRGQVI